jgi:hypothetical protein
MKVFIFDYFYSILYILKKDLKTETLHYEGNSLNLLNFVSKKFTTHEAKKNQFKK